MKRCLLLVTDLAYGGAETQVVHLALRLKARGWKVFVITLLSPKAYVDELESQHVPVASIGIQNKVPNPELFHLILRLVRLIKKWKPHIVHSHMVHANILARIVRIFASVPVLISTAHNIDERGRGGSGKLRTLLYRITDPLCDLTTQVSQAGLERYVRIGAVPKHKIRYIPNGVDTERFCPNQEVRARLRKELGLSESFVWLAVGRFDPQKDHTTMLYAFSLVIKKCPNNAHLLIVGDGPLKPSMNALAQELGIAERVSFLGIRRDVPKLMNAADAYVMSSAWEGMPMVLLEAHATGLPIVATDVGGNREVVLHEKTGFLVPPKNHEALAQAMLRLMDLPQEELRRMGETARKHIEANFNLDRVVDEWEALYRELLAQKGLL